MARRDKRVQQLRVNPKSVMPTVLDAVLVQYGFEGEQRGGSHRVYRHPRLAYNLVIPQRKPLLPTYVRKALAAIAELEDLSE